MIIFFFLENTPSVFFFLHGVVKKKKNSYNLIRTKKKYAGVAQWLERCLAKA